MYYQILPNTKTYKIITTCIKKSTSLKYAPENTVNFLDSSSSSSNGLAAAVGGTVGACVFLVIGCAMAIFLIRYKCLEDGL